MQVGEGTDRLEFLRSVFGDMGDLTAALLSNLARISEDMTAEEQRSAKVFVQRVLEIAEVKTTVASELVRTGQERVAAAATTRERVIGYLLQSVGLLADGETVRARQALTAADNESEDTLQPYVYWALSLCARADRDIGEALSEAQRAIVLVEFAGSAFRDTQPLFSHALALRARATNQQWNRFRTQLRNTLNPGQRLLWDALTSRVQSPAKLLRTEPLHPERGRQHAHLAVGTVGLAGDQDAVLPLRAEVAVRHVVRAGRAQLLFADPLALEILQLRRVGLAALLEEAEPRRRRRTRVSHSRSSGFCFFIAMRIGFASPRDTSTESSSVRRTSRPPATVPITIPSAPTSVDECECQCMPRSSAVRQLMLP